jgi:prepilin-type N-terminal cleavage/methylation domain-containing protein
MKLASKNKTPLRSGFTLIELIIVMSIMTIILSIVGPLSLKMIDKAQAQSEYIQLKNELRKISYLAFASASVHELTFENKQVTLTKGLENKRIYYFEYLTFAPQSIVFNSHGYPYPEALSLSFLKKNEEVNLFKLVEGVDASVKK